MTNRSRLATVLSRPATPVAKYVLVRLWKGSHNKRLPKDLANLVMDYLTLTISAVHQKAMAEITASVMNCPPGRFVFWIHTPNVQFQSSFCRHCGDFEGPYMQISYENTMVPHFFCFRLRYGKCRNPRIE
jgi:hypothetical protein